MSVGYLRPRSVEEAVAALTGDGAHALAGGVEVVLAMNAGRLVPRVVVSLGALDELRGVRATDDELDIGALCTHEQLAHDGLLASWCPAARGLFAGIGNLRVRGAGTIGGNLVQADPLFDPPVLLSVLGARADVTGPSGERTVTVEDLATGRERLGAGELLTRVRVPRRPVRTAERFVKFRSGSEDDYATVSVAARLGLGEDGLVTEARLAVGAAGRTVAVLADAGAPLRGLTTADEQALEAVAEAVRAGVDPVGDQRGSADYKRHLAGVVAVRALRECASVLRA